ncbi:MAG: S-layer homology domain-containing protein [Negativicutes bacterium]|nr:S-layer homology domain-containing protein [Negativicutes bacterium]
MKKALVVLMVFVFVSSIAGVASAAAFSDLPANHWAYKAVSELAKAGIVQGDGDGTFRGNRTMTRYEMAMIVANAMTKEDQANAEQKALIEKLAAEFKAELQSLDARLTKVEDNTKVRFSGTQQLFFGTTSLKAGEGGAWGGGSLSNSNWFGERLRLVINTASDDNKFMYYGRAYQTRSNFEKTASDTSSASFDRSVLIANNTFGGTLEVGRNYMYIGKGAFVGSTGNIDSAMYKITSGITTFRLAEGNWGGYGGHGEISFAQVSFKPDAGHDIGAYVFKNTSNTKIYSVFGLADIGNGMGLQFEAARNTAAGVDKSGYIVSLLSNTKGGDMVPQNNWTLVNPKKALDSAWGLSYRHLPDGVSGPANIGSGASFTTILTDPAGAVANTFDGVNVLGFDYFYVPYKNLVLQLEYDNIKFITNPNQKVNNLIVGSVTFYF